MGICEQCGREEENLYVCNNCNEELCGGCLGGGTDEDGNPVCTACQ